MTTEDALILFKIKVPTTANALKSRYRALAKLEHPDVSKHPDREARARDVNEAYAVLSTAKGIFEETEATATTTTGERLADLGKGLGPTTSGAPCEQCRGMGYYGRNDGEWRDCPDCRVTGFFNHQLRCLKCRGEGTFHRNGKVVGKCFKCNGKGWITRDYLQACPTCKGTMLVKSGSRKKYDLCTGCCGKGETPMWNPVIPRGLLL